MKSLLTIAIIGLRIFFLYKLLNWIYINYRDGNTHPISDIQIYLCFMFVEMYISRMFELKEESD